MKNRKNKPRLPRAHFQAQPPVVEPSLPVESFDPASINEAKKIILGTSEWFAFSAQGILINRDTEKTSEWGQDASDFEKENYPETKPKDFNLGNEALGALSATVYLVASHAVRTGQNAINLTISAVNHPRNSLRGLFRDSPPFDSGNLMHRAGKDFHEFSPAQQVRIIDNHKQNEESNLQIIQEYLERLDVLLGRKEASPEEDLHPAFYYELDEEGRKNWDDEADDYRDTPDPAWTDPQAALETCLDRARDIRILADEVEWPDSYLSFANVYPEAVEFIERSKAAAFLYYADGRQQTMTDVEEISYFLQQPWLRLAGNLELKISPEILNSLRSELQRSLIKNDRKIEP